MKIKWGFLGMVLSAAAVVCEFLNHRDEEAQRDERIAQLEGEVASLQTKED